jgi:hypothetical protein
MKAFKLTIPKEFPGMVSIYVAETAAKARYKAWLSYNDAFDISFKDFIKSVKIVREPLYDKEAQNQKEEKSIGWKDDNNRFRMF